MQYRTFGNVDFQPSALGFGMMRLPQKDGAIDEELATEMVRHAIDNGVNYIDTAYGYHGGESERFTGRVLQDGYREKVKLATKLPCWQVNEAADMDKLLDEQLEKTQSGYIDFYLLHALSKGSWEKMKGFDAPAWMEKKREEGKIRYLGFSFHDSTEVLKEIIDDYDGWDFCQIQYNLMDTDQQAGTEGLKYAAEKGLAVVIMEPLRGGSLASDPPQNIRDLWAEADSEGTPVDHALQWLWDQPEVSLCLSGMSAMDHVLENLESADRSAAGSLSEHDRELAVKVKEAYEGLCPVPCTKCGYCQPCPSDVKIPRIFEIYNEGHMYNSMERSKNMYTWLKEENRAHNCVECGKCEELCPQGIQIIEELKNIDTALKKDE